MNHSPEPWKVAAKHDSKIGTRSHIEDANGRLVCFVPAGPYYEAIGLVNMSRIVACLAACRGIPSNKLESDLLIDTINGRPLPKELKALIY